MKDKLINLKIQKVKLSDLKLDLTNLRGHGESEIELIIRSLTIFGQFKPLIVDKSTMQVKIGNGRLMAMRKMGWTECDCILINWENNKGLEVIDNRLNELSSWQDKDLNKWFKDKGSDWWGIDDEIAPKVEKIIKKEENKKNKKEKTKDIQQNKSSENNLPICPCCGKNLIKKSRIVLD